VRKFGSTHARKCRCTKDEKYLRGRWKKGRVSDVYNEIELPFPDAKVAGKLCIGGPCKYVIKDGSGVANAFLLEHVVPRIRTRFPAEVALVLAKPLLWMVFSSIDYLPAAMRERIRTAYFNIPDNARVLPADENPVKKVLLVITGDEGLVYLDEVGDPGNDERGIGGRKAARLFSREERGRAKHKYHRGKVVWDCVAGLVRAGFSSEVAIDRVYQVYGENTTVTRIINKMKEDRQAGQASCIHRCRFS
jgi:hypothetical protein